MKQSLLAAIAVFFGTAYAAEPGYILIGADTASQSRQAHSISLCTRSNQCPDELKFPASGGLFPVKPGVYKISKIVIGATDGSYKQTIPLSAVKAVEVHSGAVTLVGEVGLDMFSRKVKRTFPVALQDSVCDQHSQLIGTTPLYDAFNDAAGPMKVMCRTKMDAPPRRDGGNTMTASAGGERL